MCTCSIKEVNGDLFSADESYSMAHCVAADMRLGKGIAVKFRTKFGQMHTLKQQEQKPGGVAVLQDKSRFIYYLVTKESSWAKPTYQSLNDSLNAMKIHMGSQLQQTANYYATRLSHLLSESTSENNWHDECRVATKRNNAAYKATLKGKATRRVNATTSRKWK
ncbi:ADP-ribose glycohydrolase OARD1 isoform X1 [Eurosta solidaginis]|uniref:ADP-ribose glycohydrolase OARD1 isoform X1 n=1 Tax=Eurosta solidaginis TaxID=178769 RepID=UPI003530F269